MKIFKLLPALALIIFCQVAYTQQIDGFKTIYVIRHAEKDTGADPRLSAAGLKRAGDLYRFLANKGVTRIYQTRYRRSYMTGDSLRIYNKIDTAFYKADTTGQGLMESIAFHNGNQHAILVIGHSNTVSAIIRSFGVTSFTVKDIPDSEYNKMYIISRKKNRSTLKIVSYGSASAGNQNQMKL